MKEHLRKYLDKNSQLSLKTKQNLINQFREAHIPQNTIWVKQGHLANDVLFLVNGVMRLYKSNNHEEITIEFVYPKMFTSTMEDTKVNYVNPWNYQAITDCDVLLINKKQHQKMLLETPELYAFYENQLKREFAIKEQKLIAHLQLNAEERYNKLFSEHAEIFNLIPLKQIASFLGISPETLSRIRAKISHKNS